jgi:hypothetical protein
VYFASRIFKFILLTINEKQQIDKQINKCKTKQTEKHPKQQQTPEE